MRWQHVHQAAYGLWFLVPLTPVISIWTQWFGVPASVAAWLPLCILYGIYPLLQIALPFKFPELDCYSETSKSWILLYRLINTLSFPFVAFMLALGAGFWTTAQIDPLSSVAYVVGVGAFNSFISLNIGHELLHGGNHNGLSPAFSCGPTPLHQWNDPGRSRVLAALALSTACFGVFSIAHLQRHHKYVGTAQDHHTARRHECLYAFLVRALSHEACTSLGWARRVILQRDYRPTDATMTLALVFSATWATLFYLNWGSRGLAFFLIQSLVCIVFLEWANYLQHYGIERTVATSGRLQPVAQWHSWNEDLWLSDIFMLGLFRHSDHHMNPGKPYFWLSKSNLAPSYPLPFTMMMGVSLIPPLFFWMAGRVLDANSSISKNCA